MISTIRRFITLLLIITSPLWISSGLWKLRPELPLKLSLVDYTVPYDNYAEHSASVWAFNHLKLTPPALVDSSSSSMDVQTYEPWRYETAYTGPEPFKPYIQKQLSQTYPLESIQHGQALPYDLIYIADTYGVYREDFVTKIKQEGQIKEISSTTDPDLLKLLFDQGEIEVHMDYSKLIFGGLSEDDLSVIEGHTKRGGDVFFEFNAFCDPTKPHVRARAESVVGVEWTGWSGRFLPNPHDKNDSPHWLERQFKTQYPDKELPKVPSLLLAHRDGRVFLIESQEEGSEVIPTLHVNKDYRERFTMANTPYYYFWFAIMKPIPDKEVSVLAEIHLNAPSEQREIYSLLNIPTRIPLLTERAVGDSHRFHLSIDGSDIREELGQYDYAGLAFLNSLSPKNRGMGVNQRKVFWQFFLPMLKVVLWERTEARYADFPPPLWKRILNIMELYVE